MAITRQEFDDALDFVRDLYDQRDPESYRERTMGALARIATADRIVFGDFDIEQQAARLSMLPPAVKDQDGTVDGTAHGGLAGVEQTFGSHPLFRYYLQTADGRAQKATQIMTRARFRDFCAKDEFTRQFGAKFQMGLFFTATPSIVTAIVLARAQRDFTERDRALLNRLYPHLVQGFRNSAALTRISREVHELTLMLEGPASSVIVLSGDGRVKQWTEQARRWINRYCRTPFPAAEDRLPECFADWYQSQLQQIAHELSSPRPRDPLIVDKEGRQLNMQLVPDHRSDEHLLLLHEKRADATWSALGRCGLTPRESEVLAWVAKGKTNAEVGRILQMSARTVQKHLEHIYQKLGVETRTTATVRALHMGIGD
jgi:DNA-binding CsgD family transcriptional regulator